MQVFFQFFFGGKSRTINTLEHLVVFIAAPVGTSNAHKLERLYTARGGAMRAGTQVGEVALGIGADNGIFRQVFNQFHLVGFIFCLEFGQSFFPGQFIAHQRIVGFDDFAHFFFNGSQIFRRKNVFTVQVIVEAFVNGRANGKLRAREQMLNGLGHDMGSRMANGMEAFFRIRSNEFHLGIVVQGIAQIFVDTVNLGQQGLFAQFLGQALGNGQQAAAYFNFFYTAIQQFYLNH